MFYRQNADGIRVEKHITNNSTGTTESHYYDYNGTTLVCERWVDNTVWYLYDESGSPRGLTYNGTEYYYLKNLQGDITGIADANGNIVAEYTYDVWGKLLSITDANGNDIFGNTSHIGVINPLRYRGYYYDNETGLYYVTTRYYDPEVGRFISPDNAEILLATPNALTDKNLYAYCDNNPVVRADNGGKFWGFVARAIVGVAIKYVEDVVDNISSGKTGWDALKPKSSVGQYIAAGVSAMIPGSGIGNSIARSVVSEGIMVTEQVIKGQPVDIGASAISIARNTAVDFGANIVSDRLVGKVESLGPRNYSSYAGAQRKINPNLTKQQIEDKMRALGKRIRFATTHIPIIVDLGFALMSSGR